ncbi:SH3 domain-containing protein [Lentinula aciculospora]|uniref:SH3 domain-containing protein n=1 Tax=Lentinula aciculospora TaxID=153920 RepID=A0A9W9A1P7_9AGAR|nr:SH3 domain-containing protein [Lentinula aciculospora]
MAVRSQASTSSLSKYATAKSPGVDLYNGSISRDFCNSFWGEGDAGVNVLFARMRGSARTTDDLRSFWKERSAIEEEYARKLLQLSQNTMGKDEIGELRNSLETLQLETSKLAQTHLQLASQIRSEMEEPANALFSKQLEHRRAIQGPLEKRYKAKVAQESYVAKAREKYHSDCVKISTYIQQLENNSHSPGTEVEKTRIKLKRAEQTVGANEKDYAAFAKALADMMPGWESDWRGFCDTCQDLEEERLDFMKDNLWAYANSVSTVCVADDESCESIRTVLDQLETERDILAFVQEYGTGSSIPNPPEFIPYSTSLGKVDGTSSTTSLSLNNMSNAAPTANLSHPAGFARKSRKSAAPAAPPYAASQTSSGSGSAAVTAPPPPPSMPPPSIPPAAHPAILAQQQQQHNLQRDASNASRGSASRGASNYHHRTPSPAPARIPPSQQSQSQLQPSISVSSPPRNAVRRMTLPPQPTDNEVAAPIPPVPTTGERNKILFYVEAMYDYTATIDEEFNFQAGDIIAVTDIPDDGWWSGELLDEARREEGRHVFPSNFVRLF